VVVIGDASKNATPRPRARSIYSPELQCSGLHRRLVDPAPAVGATSSAQPARAVGIVRGEAVAGRLLDVAVGTVEVHAGASSIVSTRRTGKLSLFLQSSICTRARLRIKFAGRPADRRSSHCHRPGRPADHNSPSLTTTGQGRTPRSSPRECHWRGRARTRANLCIVAPRAPVASSPANTARYHPIEGFGRRSLDHGGDHGRAHVGVLEVRPRRGARTQAWGS
jgi:hypothetical protein